MDSYKAYTDLINEEQAQMEEFLEGFANVNSGSSNEAGIHRAIKYFTEGIKDLPGDTEVLPLPGIRQVCRPEAPVQVLLSGHIDTVYGQEHSFQECKQIEENKLNGPGVADMKGGLTVMLYALKAFEQSPWAANIGWEIFINSDEEVGSGNSREYLEKAAERFNLAIAFEPSLPDGSLVRSRKGSATATLKTQGRPSHVGRDFEAGRNAILALSGALLAIHELNREFPNAIINVGQMEGGGPVNVVPEFASAKINFRTSTKEEHDQVVQELNTIAKTFNEKEGYSFELEMEIFRPAKPLSPAIEDLFTFYKNCAKELGMELDWKDTGGCSDGNNLAAGGLPNLDNLGVRGNYIHSDQEFVLLDSLVERAQLTCLFLMKLAAGEIKLNPNHFPNTPS